MWHVFVILALFMIAELRIFSPVYSRKLVHIGMGLMIADLGHPINPQLYIFVIIVAITSIILSLFYPFTFGKKNDFGIITYNVFVLIWIILKFPVKFILPMVVCDPIAAIVGLNIPSPKWNRKKSIAGSFAVLVSGYLCLYYIKSLIWRIIISILLCICEGFGGDYDNFFISLLLIIVYIAAKPLKIPLDRYILNKPLFI